MSKLNNLNGKKIAIFGGSFNPVHNGHLLTAQKLYEYFHFDYILFIPANIPVHKNSKDFPDATHRLNMVKLAIENYPYFIYSDIEIKRGGFTYTIDTVMELKQRFPLIQKISFIIGDDLLSGLSSWKNIDQLLQEVELICLKRSKDNIADTDYPVLFFLNPLYDISSTEIRKRIKAKLPIDFMLPDRVKKYILDNQLYITSSLIHKSSY
ncbi:MAG: nicotinate-nucleotide adenylyltransferase [Spirochaetes bacterium]|nr:nicotinate-nucleotide adenylyltransferase [Spirochaetota bacterium]